MNGIEEGGSGPENFEARISQELRDISHQLGFQETPELLGIQRGAVEQSKMSSGSATEKMYENIAQIQILGMEITGDQLSRVGLDIQRAATLLECGQYQLCLDELELIYNPQDINIPPSVNKLLLDIIKRLQQLIGAKPQ